MIIGRQLAGRDYLTGCKGSPSFHATSHLLVDRQAVSGRRRTEVTGLGLGLGLWALLCTIPRGFFFYFLFFFGRSPLGLERKIYSVGIARH